MSRLKIAVAGAGLIGRTHIELVQASEACELAAIVDPAEGARDIAAAYAVPLFNSLGELFDHRRPDAVILATPNALHVEQSLECIDAGVPALIEKPVAHSLAEGSRLLACADAAGVPLLVGHHRSHSPVMAVAEDLVRRGVLGDLVAVGGSALFYKPDDYFDVAPWRRQPGGGPVLINMIHEIGNLRQLCGEIEAVQAMASSARRGFPVEDTVAITLRFAGGALGSFLLSDTAGSARSWEQTAKENPSYAAYPDEDCYHIAGTDGSLSIPTMRLKRYGRREDRSWWKRMDASFVDAERQDPLARQLAHFCEVIREQAEPRVTVRDGLQNLRVVEAISEAARTGETIQLAS